MFSSCFLVVVSSFGMLRLQRLGYQTDSSTNSITIQCCKLELVPYGIRIRNVLMNCYVPTILHGEYIHIYYQLLPWPSFALESTTGSRAKCLWILNFRNLLYFSGWKLSRSRCIYSISIFHPRCQPTELKCKMSALYFYIIFSP